VLRCCGVVVQVCHGMRGFGQDENGMGSDTGDTAAGVEGTERVG
jgi:hypothetical protein